MFASIYEHLQLQSTSPKTIAKNEFNIKISIIKMSASSHNVGPINSWFEFITECYNTASNHRV